MLSLRARLFLALLRNRHLLQFKLRPETGAEWETDLPGVRRKAEKGSRMLGKVPKGLEIQKTDINGMPAEWIIPEDAPDGKAIMYFHGGGYVLGSVEAHRNIVAKFVRETGIRAFVFGYRLAPEHPYPAALEDARAAYCYLLMSGVAPNELAFVGDSAGGGLALATLLNLKDRGTTLPAAAAVLSPWTDLQCTGESLTANSGRCLAPKESWLACRKHYAQGQDCCSPYISPLYGDLEGLPPLFITAGGYETLLSDATRLADKAREAGVDVTLKVGPKMCHCYPACAPIFPEATQALWEICAFIRAKLKD